MKTLYLRIVFTTIFVMILSGILAFILANFYYQSKLKPYNDSKVTHLAKDIVTFYEQNQEISLNDYLENASNLGYQLYVVDQDGNGSFYGGEFRKKELDSEIIQNVLNGHLYHGILDFPSSAFITGFFDNVLTNTIGMRMTVDDKDYALFVRPNLDMQFGEMRIFFSVLLILSLLLSILFVIVSTRYIVKPIIKLTDATKRISTGKYDIQLDMKRRDEIGKLADHFREMAKNLEQLESMRQEFVSNVSHEIQAPLTSIQGFSQTLQSDTLPEEQRKHYLAIIEAETKRMSQLSKQLLTLASLDKEEHLIKKSTFDVAEQIKQVIFMSEWSWQEKELAIDLSLPTTFIYADQHLLHQVWTNLLTNSIKFTSIGGTISIRLTEIENDCIVEVKDTGIGIAQNDLANIFNRFYKADKARIRSEAGSSGLGLAITKKIVELHEGKISVASQMGKGTTFRIQLPRM
ncbi:sensor histidine kinase [Peribacillus loiseleuriae]|uniref:Heme sensor protein HssS n=1 Tax=Peribacillus loiseleuriae TaxID=1679170 RepID=A0A0K9GXL6_9BACI|nr:HAMP domain-containing sensor histidine kinase [Peribacillus loiseleuriae]KMY51375.1 membrane protein [Peribacillus loiseleuriae]